MGKCEYSFYQSGDRCRIKAGLPGESSDRVGQDTYKNFCTYTDGHKKCPFYLASQKSGGQSGGCYLTSACVRARGLADDCEELQILRAFRDNWLRAQPYGPSSIHEYYCVAPTIVSNIDKNPDAVGIYDSIYSKVILPCIRYIQAGRNAEAFSLYKEATKTLLSHFN